MMFVDESGYYYFVHLTKRVMHETGHVLMRTSSSGGGEVIVKGKET